MTRRERSRQARCSSYRVQKGRHRPWSLRDSRLDTDSLFKCGLKRAKVTLKRVRNL